MGTDTWLCPFSNTLTGYHSTSAHNLMHKRDGFNLAVGRRNGRHYVEAQHIVGTQ